MGKTLDLIIREVAYQVGWEDYIQLPPPISEETVNLGNTAFTETCSPYALCTGSIIQGIRKGLAERGNDVPRRIIVLMIRGEGPCTVGWYALVQSKLLPELLRDELEPHGHTVELATIGLDGVGDLLRELAELGDSDRIEPVLQYVEAYEEGLDKLPFWRRWWLKWRLTRFISEVLDLIWPKLHAAEELRAQTLISRAHELQRGSVTQAYHEGVELLARAHSPKETRQALEEALQLIEEVPQDSEPKQRAVVVGEIYVALTSFANRGAVENLMGREGVELVTGVTLSEFLHYSLLELKRRSWANHPLVRPVLELLEQLDMKPLRQRPRDTAARPFMEHEVGGDGMLSVANARRQVEEGVQGILHVYPFKCMPEGLAKDALIELSQLYGVRYLSSSFDRETDIQRLKTELATFASLLKSDLASAGVHTIKERKQLTRKQALKRRMIGFVLNRLPSIADDVGTALSR
jgi:hypothetical protein